MASLDNYIKGSGMYMFMQRTPRRYERACVALFKSFAHNWPKAKK